MMMTISEAIDYCEQQPDSIEAFGGDKTLRDFLLIFGSDQDRMIAQFSDSSTRVVFAARVLQARTGQDAPDWVAGARAVMEYWANKLPTYPYTDLPSLITPETTPEQARLLGCACIPALLARIERQGGAK